jgi:uncharacterized protein YuzE
MAMRIAFDPANDLLNVTLLPDVPVADSREVEGMVFEYATDRRIVAIEIQGARQRINTELMKVIGAEERKSAA